MDCGNGLAIDGRGLQRRKPRGEIGLDLLARKTSVDGSLGIERFSAQQDVSCAVAADALREPSRSKDESEAGSREAKRRGCVREANIAGGEEVRACAPGASVRVSGRTNWRRPHGLKELLDAHEAQE